MILQMLSYRTLLIDGANAGDHGISKHCVCDGANKLFWHLHNHYFTMHVLRGNKVICGHRASSMSECALVARNTPGTMHHLHHQLAPSCVSQTKSMLNCVLLWEVVTR